MTGRAARTGGEGALTRLARRFEIDDDGATAIEYGLIVALIAVAIIGAVGAVRESTSNNFSNARIEITGQ